MELADAWMRICSSFRDEFKSHEANRRFVAFLQLFTVALLIMLVLSVLLALVLVVLIILVPVVLHRETSFRPEEYGFIVAGSFENIQKNSEKRC